MNKTISESLKLQLVFSNRDNLCIIGQRPQSPVPLTTSAALLSPAVMWKEHVYMLLADRLALLSHWIADMSYLTF